MERTAQMKVLDAEFFCGRDCSLHNFDSALAEVVILQELCPLVPLNLSSLSMALKSHMRT